MIPLLICVATAWLAGTLFGPVSAFVAFMVCVFGFALIQRALDAAEHRRTCPDCARYHRRRRRGNR